MLYRALRAVHGAYALTLFWLYLGAFFVAFCFVFILPIVTITLLFLAILLLPAAYIGNVLLGLVVRWLARGPLNAGRCPRCGRPLEVPGPEGRRTCGDCLSIYEASGQLIDPDTLAEPYRPDPPDRLARSSASPAAIS